MWPHAKIRRKREAFRKLLSQSFFSIPDATLSDESHALYHAAYLPEHASTRITSLTRCPEPHGPAILMPYVELKVESPSDFINALLELFNKKRREGELVGNAEPLRTDVRMPFAAPRSILRFSRHLRSIWRNDG
jgi:translation elongation factor EF-4